MEIGTLMSMLNIINIYRGADDLVLGFGLGPMVFYDKISVVTFGDCLW